MTYQSTLARLRLHAQPKLPGLSHIFHISLTDHPRLPDLFSFNSPPSLASTLPSPSQFATMAPHSTETLPFASPDTSRMGRLAGKNCIITGGAGGIGLETAILFLREGAHVLLSDISQPALDRAVGLLKKIVPDAKEIETRTGDVSKEADVQAMIEHVDSWGGVDVLFNNAGIMHSQDADAIDTPEKIWDLTQAINVKGVWFGSKHAVISFRKHGKKKASVINTASVVALVGSATPQLAYTASKGAVLALTRELAIVHAREGFRFNALCPAPLNTPLLQDWLGDDAAKRQRREVHFPTGRFGEAIEQAQAVLFLASDESSFVNGTDFVVDGGMSRCYITPEGPPTAPPVNNAPSTSHY